MKAGFVKQRCLWILGAYNPRIAIGGHNVADLETTKTHAPVPSRQ